MRQYTYLTTLRLLETIRTTILSFKCLFIGIKYLRAAAFLTACSCLLQMPGRHNSIESPPNQQVSARVTMILCGIAGRRAGASSRLVARVLLSGPALRYLCSGSTSRHLRSRWEWIALLREFHERRDPPWYPTPTHTRWWTRQGLMPSRVQSKHWHLNWDWLEETRNSLSILWNIMIHRSSGSKIRKFSILSNNEKADGWR